METTSSAGARHLAACPICGCSTSVLVWSEDGWDLEHCAECGVVYLGNPPTPEELDRLYSFESGFHNDLSDGSSDQAGSARRAGAHFADMVSHSRSTPGSVLDVGCAAGYFLDEVTKRDWVGSGVEFSADTAAVARGRFGLDITVGTIDAVDTSLSPEGSGFDAVTMWDVLEHVPDPVHVVRAARGLVAPGGSLWISTPNIGGLFPAASLRVAGRVGKWPHPEPPFHLFQFSVDTLTDVLTRGGFVVIEVHHERIPLSFTFGTPKRVLAEPKRLAYTLVFAPLAAVGPLVGRGDSIVVRAIPASAL